MTRGLRGKAADRPGKEPAPVPGSNGPRRFLPLALLTLTLCFLVTLSLCHGEETAAPLSFRKQLLTPDRLAQELKRVQDGVLVRLPLADFEECVRQAARAAARKKPPRLVEAHYHATLKDEALVGDGQWKVIHAGPAPALLKLDDFNLALRKARFENGDATIADFDGHNPALLVETAGQRTVSLEWSARAESGPEGLQFNLKMPPCPAALLELDVPTERAVNVLDGSLLSGPYSTDSLDLRRWKIVCRKDQKEVNLRVRPADRPEKGVDPRPTAKLVRQRTVQKLCPEGLDVTFEVTLVEALSRGVRELVCEYDPELRPIGVVGPHVDNWSAAPGNGKTPSRLTIRFRESVHEGTWQVSCLAPLTASPAPAGAPRTIAWKSPGLRVIGGVPRGETIEVFFHPDLRVENWDLGGFRLSGSTSSYDAARQVRMRHLTLVGGGLAPDKGPPRRPNALVQAYGVEFRARQLAWWRCDASGMSLTLQIGYDVIQGQLFQLPVLLPAGWVVERVEMSPASLLRNYLTRPAGSVPGGPAAEKGRETLQVDLTRPLVSAEEALREGGLPPRPLTPEGAADSTAHPAAPGRARVPTLTVHLRPAGSGAVTNRKLPFPDAIPLGARFREGALALDCDERLFHLDVRTESARSEPEEDGPWGKQVPDYYYRYRGQRVNGALLVQQRPPRLRARCTSDVFVASGRAAVETHLVLEAEVGSPDAIDLSLSADGPEPWQWRNEPDRRGGETAASGNRVLRAQRLHLAETASALHVLGAGNALQAASLFAARPAGERWRLTLARPLRAREPLSLHTTRHLQARDGRWHVPLPVVLSASHMDGEVTLHLAGADLVQVETTGLREASSAGANGAAAWRTFRYGQTEAALTLFGQPRAAGRSPESVIDRARLIIYVGAGGVLQHHFSFQVANWPQHTLPLRLPPGSSPVAIQVDGHWLPRLITSAPPPAEDADPSADPRELALPVPGRGDTTDSAHRFEVVYTRRIGSGLLWQYVEAPVPMLPVAPLAFRRTWRLPAGLTPLRDGRYQPMPGTHDDVEPGELPRQPAGLFRLSALLPRLDPLLGDDKTGANDALARAVESLHGSRAGQVMTLREVVSEIAFAHLKDRYPLVVDVLALREAGIDRDAPLTIKPLSPEEPTPPWTERGLITVPAHSAILLTTVSGRGAAIREPIPEPLEQAIAAAVLRGQDSSGRFRSALSWLRPDVLVAAAPPPPPPLGLGSDPAGWSEWEPVAGLDDDALLVVRHDLVSGVGLALALVLALFFWKIRQRPIRWRLLFLFLALAGSGLGLLWLPAALQDLAWWPLLAACGGALVWYLRAIARSSADSKSQDRNPKCAAVAAVLLLVILGWTGRAAAPSPVTIYLVPGLAEAPENQTVLVPADFLNRLKALARPVSLVEGGPRAVLLDAAYEGKLVEGQAEFMAVFTVQCLTDEPASLAVPLDGVQLVGDVLRDGQRAHPLAVPAPGIGYALKVQGRGRHKVELHFRAPVAGAPEDRNVLFTVPPLMHSHLSWHVPTGAAWSRSLVQHGAQWTAREADGEHLEVDLGRLTTPLHLHWHQAAQPVRPPRVQYEAAYLWDLHLEASRLTAWLRYHVLQGAVKTLDVDLPADLEVRSADGRRSRSAAPSPVWLSDWQVRAAGGKRTLHLEFPYPVAGDVQVRIELVPRTPLPRLVTLSLPAPRGERSPGAHYLAYRTHPGLEAQRDTSLNITRIEEDQFAPDWLGIARPEPSSPGAAYKIGPDRAPVLRLRLSRSRPVSQADLDIAVRAGPQLAEIQATAKLSAPNADLGFVELDLQPALLTVASVTGADVRAWKQTDRRLLVWLERTTESTRLELSGWLPVERRGGQSLLAIPCLRLPQAREQSTRLRLTAAGGLALASVKPVNLQRVASPPGLHGAGESEWTFETRQGNYGGSCEVQPAANATAQVLTFAEVSDRQLQFTTTIVYTVKRGELPRIHLRLRNWESEQVKLIADRVAKTPSPRRTPGERSWVLDLQPGVIGQYRVTLRGSMPLEEAAPGVLLPDVSVLEVEHAQYIVAISGGELTADPRGRLQHVANPAKDLAAWPGAADRVGRTHGEGWRVTGAEWQLRLVPHARMVEAARVRIFLLEQSAAVVDGRRWLHESRCWLRHEAHTDLNVDFPASARVIAAAVDGVEVTPLQPGPSRLWLPLPGRAGVRCVRLRWLYNDAEPLDRPNLTPPVVVDALQGPALWTVQVPAGWDPELSTPDTRLGMGPARQAALALHRAEAQLRVSQSLCERNGDTGASAPLIAAQRRFALYCQHAQHALDMGADRGGVTGPDGQGLTDWLHKLQGDNRELTHKHGLDELRADAERKAGASDVAEPDLTAEDDNVARFTGLDRGRVGGATALLPQRGTPISWRGNPGAAPPVLRLALRENQRTRHALAASGQWLGVLVAGWLLSFSPFLLARLRLFWPEQVALLGALGWYLAGPTLIVLFLFLLALCSRLLLLAGGLRAFLRRRLRPPATAATPSANGS